MRKLYFLFLLAIFNCKIVLAQKNNVIESPLQVQMENSGEAMIGINILLASKPIDAKTAMPYATSSMSSAAPMSKRAVQMARQKQLAKQAQTDILAQLKVLEKQGKVSDITSLWMANAINCKAAPEAIKVLSSLSEVVSIGLDQEFQIANSVGTNIDLPYVNNSAAPHVLQVKANQVWQMGYTGKNVIVAVLDSGTNPEHVDLKDNLWVGYADTDGDGIKDEQIHGWNFTTKDAAGNANITDEYGHGTHCAGIVCGKGVAGNITGVAPDASLMTVKVIGRNGGGSPANMIKGVEFAIENGASVLSISSGFKTSQIGVAAKEALRRTFESALDFGVVVCAAAGNDGTSIGAPDNVDIPAACPPPYFSPDMQGVSGGKSSVICVGSVNSSDEYSTFSSQGPVTWQDTQWQDFPYTDGVGGLIRPDVCAPGDFIYSSRHDENDKYKIYSGTSQATPCVAGIIALLLEKNEHLTPAQICETLESTAKHLSDKKNNLTGSGRVDALTAINAVTPASTTPYVRTARIVSPRVNRGENVALQFEMVNYGQVATSDKAKVTLTTNDSYVTIVSGETTLGELSTNSSTIVSFTADISASTPMPHIAYFQIQTEDNGVVWTDNVQLSIEGEPRLLYQSGAPLTLDAGKRHDMTLTLVNAGTVPTSGASNVVLQSKSSYLTWIESDAVVPVLRPGETAEVTFAFEISQSIPDGEKISFDIYATPNNYTDVRTKMYEFETGVEILGYADDGFNGWTTFDASPDGRDHAWWHSSLAVKHRVESAGLAASGRGQMMSEAYCQGSMIEYDVPVDNYLVSPRVRITADSKFTFKARVHSSYFYGEHFGVAISEKGNKVADDFTTIQEWSIQTQDGTDWITYSVDLSAYAGRDVYVAIRHFFTEEQWRDFNNGYDLYVLHIDDAQFTDIIDVSDVFVYNNYSYFDVTVNSSPLPAPANLVAKALDETSVQLSWDAVTGAKGYNVYRDGVLVAEALSSTSYTDNNLQSDTQYAYTVAAVRGDHVYEQSASVLVRTAQAEYSVAILDVSPRVLQLGENQVEITFINNGRYEHLSRSTVLLTSTSPCVSVQSASVGINALMPGQTVARTFSVVLSEPLPADGVVDFNANVTYRYEPYTSWDCPFVLSVPVETGLSQLETKRNIYVDRVALVVTGVQGEVTIGLYDLTGKMLMQRQCAADESEVVRIDCSHLPRGVYIVRCSDSSGQQSHKVRY